MAYTYIDTNDNYWSGLPSSKADLPLITSRLIRRTTPGLQSALIPIGISTYTGGWDGVVENIAATEFVPSGLSLWEMGTEKSPSAKAEKDYTKRKENTDKDLSARSTFVFVTTRAWQRKQDWINKKIAENFFADVQVIDADRLVEWLNISPVNIHDITVLIGRKIDANVQPLSAFWKEWASGPKKKMIPASLVTAGRETQSNELITRLSGPPALITVRAGTREEALAFTAAAIQSQAEQQFDNTVIVDSKESLLEMMPTKLSLIIANLPDYKPLYNINLINQHVLLPLAAADKFDDDQTIRLSKLGREETVKALQEMDLDEDHARSLSHKSGRSLNVIRRILGFDNQQPAWVSAAEDLCPAMLIGKWRDDREGDRQIVEHLSGQSYDDYINRIRQWTLHHDAPITHLGNLWRVISPLDCWEYLGRFISRKQIILFEESFLIACGDIKPALSLKPEERKYAQFLGKTADYSRAIREGLSQTVILIANFGEANLVTTEITHQLWADHLVDKLIAKPEQDLWKSLDDIMPLLADAAPNVVLSRLENFIERQPSILEGVFENAPSLIHDSYYHTGLLWALEGMAWLPEYILRAVVLFIKLNQLDPGVKIMNRPSNSLHQVFQPIMPQTYASNAVRKQVLDTIIKKYPDESWTIFMGLLPGNSMVGHMNEKLRWREFTEDLPEIYSDEKYNDYVSFISNRLFTMAGKDVKHIVSLLNRFGDLWGTERTNLLDIIQQNVSELKEPSHLIWASIRDILYNHYNDYYPLSNLPAKAVAQFNDLYKAYTPDDLTESLIWAFNEHWAKLPERIKKKEDDWNGRATFVENRRKEMLGAIYKENTYPAFLELVSTIGEPGVFGKIASLLNLSVEERGQFAAQITSPNQKQQFAANQFIVWYQVRKGLTATKKNFQWLIKNKYTAETLIGFLLAMRSGYETWMFVETLESDIQKAYWAKCETDISDRDPEQLAFQLAKLFEAKRFISAVYLAAHEKEAFKTADILKIMERLATEKAEETVRLDHGHVTHLFKECYDRNDYEVQYMARLEWLYAEWLTDRYSPVQPKELFQEMCENPEIFAEFLKYTFPPDDTSWDNIDYEGMEEAQFMQRAKRAHSMIDNLDKVPGQFVDIDLKPALDGPVLKKWVDDLRKLANDRNRQKRAESYIGKIMAKFPENPVCWPPAPIAEIIEEIDSDRLRSSFSTTVTNKRSFTTRSPYAGGQIERNNATYFRKFEACHRLNHPVTAQIFADIAIRYDMRAREEDAEALSNDLDY